MTKKHGMADGNRSKSRCKPTADSRKPKGATSGFWRQRRNTATDSTVEQGLEVDDKQDVNA
jgi:hypothetical protein